MNKCFWFEFIEHLEERLSSIENEIASLLIHLEQLGRRREAFVYYGELRLILETIGKSYDDLAMINRDLRLEAEVLPQLRFLLAGAQYLKNSLNEDIGRLLEKDCTLEDIFYKILQSDFIVINYLINNLERALAYLKYGIDQTSGGEFLKQTVQYQYSFTGPLTDIPSWEKTLKAVSAVVHNYSELIFGRSWLEEHKIRPIAIAGFEDYSIMTPIYIAHYPIVDTFRTRFWAAFGHEIQHEKNHILRMIFLNLQRII